MAALLWALLRRTRFGTSTRAVVDNPDLSDMIGVHGDNVRRVAWILSSVFAALVGILISPTQGLDVNQLVLVVIYAFAPAILGILFGLPGRLSRRPGARDHGQHDLEVLQFGHGGQRRGGAPLPRPLRAARRVRDTPQGGRVGCGGPAAVGVALVGVGAAASGGPSGRSGSTAAWRSGLGGSSLALLVPLVIPGPKLNFVTQGFIYAMIALTLVVLTGWAGQISIAQFSFVGVGAFTAGHLAGAHGQHFLFAVLIGMLLAAPLGILVGLVSLRLSRGSTWRWPPWPSRW